MISTDPTATLVGDLQAALGREHVLVDPDLRATYETAYGGRASGEAVAVVRPGTVEAVAAILSICRAHGTGIVPQGGNTGLVEASIPRPGEGQVLLSTKRLDQMGAPDLGGEIEVGAGVTLANLQARAREFGWDAGLDIGSRDSATIGGLVSTNGGGARAIRYGTARARVSGLEAVLADGSVVRFMRHLGKDNAGFNLPSLLIGSEGTLGVVTRILWRLVPPPGEMVSVLVPVGSIGVAVELAGLLRSKVATLEALELISAPSIELASNYLGRPLPGPAAAHHLLIDCRFDESSTEALFGVLGDYGVSQGTSTAVEAKGRRRLWEFRECLPEALLGQLPRHPFDVGLPVERMAEFTDRLEQLVEDGSPAWRLVYFGHLGDGNLHLHVIGPDRDDVEVDAAVLGLVAECGGTISAEHGIGVTKAPYLGLMRSDQEIATMRAIKGALDPRQIMNPGAVLVPDEATG